MTSSGREPPHEPVHRPRPARPTPDLTDEQVRAAWRTIAAATHPDRPDGGNPARYAAASAAYGQLRTAWGRSEAYADLATDQPYIPAPAATAAPRARCRHCPRGAAAPGPHPARPPAAAAGPRHRRGRAVAAGPAPGAGAALRAGRGDRPDHLVRADRAGGSGPATGPVTNMMPPAGASGSVSGATRPRRRSGLGWKACRSPRRHPGTSRADQAGPVKVVQPWGAPP